MKTILIVGHPPSLHGLLHLYRREIMTTLMVEGLRNRVETNTLLEILDFGALPDADDTIFDIISLCRENESDNIMKLVALRNENVELLSLKNTLHTNELYYRSAAWRTTREEHSRAALQKKQLKAKTRQVCFHRQGRR